MIWKDNDNFVLDIPFSGDATGGRQSGQQFLCLEDGTYKVDSRIDFTSTVPSTITTMIKIGKTDAPNTMAGSTPTISDEEVRQVVSSGFIALTAGKRFVLAINND